MAAMVVMAGGAAVAVAASGRPQEPPAATTPLPIGPAVSPPPAQLDADDELVRAATQDEPRVAVLMGSWVVQVSSKQVGPMADGRTYTADDILLDHQSWRARFPDVALLRSERVASFRNPGLWVTVIARPFPDAERANSWCDLVELPADDCFAKRLASAAGVGRDTVPR